MVDVDQVILRLRRSNARFETPDNAQPEIASAVERVVVSQRQRRPQRDIVRRKPETARRHADDCEGFAIEPDRLPIQARSVAKAPPPQRVAQHHNTVIAVNALFAREPAPLRRIDAEQREEIRIHPCADHPLRLFIAGDVVITRAVSREMREALIALLPFAVIGHRGAYISRAARHIHRQQPRQLFRFRIWQRTQQHGIDDAEDRRVRADAQRQREDGNQGESGILQQHSRAVTKILQQVLDEADSSHIAAFLLSLLNTAQGAQGSVARLLRCHAFSDIFLNLPLEVIADLLVQFLLDLLAAEQGAQPQRDRVEPAFETHLSTLLKLHYMRDGGREPGPIGRLFFELLAAGPRQAVELGAAVILAWLPFGGDPALLLQLVEGRIERSVADLEDVAGNLLEALADRPAVQRLQCEDL